MSAMSIETFQMESCKMSKPSLIAEPISPSSSELKSPPLCHEYNDYFVNNIASIVEQLYQYGEHSGNLDWNQGQQINFSSVQGSQMCISGEPRRQCEYDTMQIPENKSSRSNDCMERSEPVTNPKINNNVAGRKRTRTTYTSDQLMNLEDVFKSNQYLTCQIKKELAQTLKLDQKQIKIWFQNRRMKLKKKDKKKSSPSNSNENCLPTTLSASTGNPSVNFSPKLQHTTSQQSTIVNRLLNHSALVQKQELAPTLQEFTINSYNPQWDNNMFYNNQYYMQPQLEGTYGGYNPQLNNLTNYYTANPHSQLSQETSETVYHQSIKNEDVPLCQNKPEAYLTDNKPMFNSYPTANVCWLGDQNLMNITPSDNLTPFLGYVQDI